MNGKAGSGTKRALTAAVTNDVTMTVWHYVW